MAAPPARGLSTERRARDDDPEETSMRAVDDRASRRGQGTQGALIAAHFNIPHIATGERCCAITGAADRPRPGG
jgi:hypothetical protein